MKRLKRASTKSALTGTVAVPGDKSISHRALILAALADGRSTLAGLNSGDDVRATADALAAMGAGIELEDNGEVEVYGSTASSLHEADAPVDAKNSGTTVRTLLGVCAGVEGLFVFVGDESLSARPMLRVVAPLRQMGARIDGRSHADLLPLVVRGGRLDAVDIELPVASAQVKTAVLLAGSLAHGTTTVVEPSQSRDHTERMLEAAGVRVDRDGSRSAIEGPTVPHAMSFTVPGDVSSAAFLVVAAALVDGSDLTIENVGLNPTRTGWIDVLRAMGADIETSEEAIEAGEPVGTISVRSSDLAGITLDPSRVPTFIDEVPVLAIAASQAEGTTVIRGARELRVKESDRIAGIAAGLRAIGGNVEEFPDGMAITGPAPLHGGPVDSLGDHRIAMAFAVAGLVADGSVRVSRWSSVETSFPEFLDVLGRAQGRIAP